MHQVSGPAPPHQGWGQIFRLSPSPPQGRNACAYAYTSSYACICVRMLAHVCTCMTYVYICMHTHALDGAAYVCLCIHMHAYACTCRHIHNL